MAKDVKQRLEKLMWDAGLTDMFDDGRDLVSQLDEDLAPRSIKSEQNGLTILHYACRNGWLDFVKFLVEEHGVNVNARDNHRATPLHYASRYGRVDILRYLANEQKCNLEQCDDERRTPLHYAVRYGRLSIIRCLTVELHCNTECLDKDKQTPLHYTCRTECIEDKALELAVFLVETAKCDVNKKEKLGNTALLLACKYGCTKIALYLISSPQCDITIRNDNGHHPLLCASYDRNAHLVRALLHHPNCSTDDRDNHGNTALLIACKRQYSGSKQLVRLLLEGGCDPNAANDEGSSPLDLTTKPDVIRELIQHGANPRDVYKTHGIVLGKHSAKKPLEPAVKFFIVGNSLTGKSTLTKAIQKEMSRFVRFVTRSSQVRGVSEKTAGIVSSEFESKSFGRVVLYDFAGEEDFRSSHAALLQNAIQTSSPSFIVVVDLSKSDEDIKRSTFYWLSFLENKCTSVNGKPHVIVVGSHADIVKGDDLKRKTDKIVLLLTARLDHSPLEFTGFVAMDCHFCDSAGMRELRNFLRTCSIDSRSQMGINFNAHCFLVYVLANFRNAVAVTVDQIRKKISEDTTEATARSSESITYFLPESDKAVEDACDQLNDKGHLLVLINHAAIEKSWIIINKSVLLAEVNGTIFAPKHFKRSIKQASSDGIIPLSTITKLFPKYNPEMIVGFLSHLEFCHEIIDTEILALLGHDSKGVASAQEERHFFFPSLVTADAPSSKWEAQPDSDYHFGWILQCSKPDQFFDPRFLQVLLLRVAFSFAFLGDSASECSDISTLKRKCSIWTNGICWVDNSGIENLVEVDQERVVVLMKCPEAKSQCFHLRSLLIQTVLKAAREFCCKLATVEAFTHPTEAIEYPLKPISELTCLEIAEIARAVIACDPSVVNKSGNSISLDSMLLFEPYTDLGEPILRNLFDEQSSAYDQEVTDDLLSDVAVHLLRKKEIVKKIFERDLTLSTEQTIHTAAIEDKQEMVQMLSLWNDGSKVSCHSLRNKLDQFSIFGGRNLFVIAQVQ